MSEIEREYGWNDTITKDADEYIILPEGDYDFVVENFERARHEGSEKLPPCNKAIVNIRVYAPNGEKVIVRHNLFLHTRTEGMLAAFFAAIGQKKKDQPLSMNWNTVPGSSGRCKITTKEYNGNKYNEVKRFYPKEDSKSYIPGQF